jgi:hypothetical protein
MRDLTFATTETGCWIANRVPSSTGYVAMKGGPERLLHRLMYREVVGPIPEGLVLDHLCRNPSCVNPAHLEPVTQTENVLRGVGPTAVNARKTHCMRGHEFTPENTYIATGRTWRNCRECGRQRDRERYKAKRARQQRP